jgi:hypothetical protein
MNVKRVVGFLVLALVVYFVIVNPTGAATMVKSIGSSLQVAATSITNFVMQIA